METFMKREVEEENERRFLTFVCLATEKCQHMNWYTRLKITGCGEVWSFITVGKALDVDEVLFEIEPMIVKAMIGNTFYSTSQNDKLTAVCCLCKNLLEKDRVKTEKKTKYFFFPPLSFEVSVLGLFFAIIIKPNIQWTCWAFKTYAMHGILWSLFESCLSLKQRNYVGYPGLSGTVVSQVIMWFL